MIVELLNLGADNPITGRELAEKLGCDPRDITQAVEEERRAGHAICSSTNSRNPGYYLAATADEIEQCCASLKRRAVAVFKTRKALLSTLKARKEQENAVAQEAQDGK